ncbi:MAG: hypothetical protein J0L79_02480 [Rickettsiales bacterium]|nr:hypothetical protein [Rickettsiales bacterium]MCA0254428.1 hypothetical protein [Pseudomonadota bacterium]
MFLEKSPVYVILFIFVGAIYSLFTIKESVMNIRSELGEVTKQIQDESDKIHLLKAELAYLTSPSRLKALNDQYIKLTDTMLAQMEGEDKKVDGVDDSTKLLASNKIRNEDIKWRFKKGPSKYVTMVSGKGDKNSK